MTDDTRAPVTSAPRQSTTSRTLPASGTLDHGRCPECDSGAVSVATDGSEYCRECGLVLSDVPVERSEPGWRPLSERRTGPATSPSRVSVGTAIGSGENPRKANRLNKYNNRLEYRTRALKEGLGEVRSLCAALELPETTESYAAYLYRQALEDSLLQGRSQEGVAGACVYAASRRYHQPVTMSDVADVSPVEQSTVSGAYRTVLKELGLGIRPPEPGDFLPRVAATAGVPYRVERRAGELLERAISDQRHVGQSPAGVAAAALYAACRELGEDVTQAALAEAAGVSNVTLSRQWQSFADYIE